MSAQETALEAAELNAAAIAEVDAVLAELEANETKKPEGDDGPNMQTSENGEDEVKESKGENGHVEERNSEDERSDSGQARRNDRRRNDNYRGGRGSRGGGRGGFKRGNNIKSNLISEEKSSDPVAIRKQVEFYFSDSNLPQDQFLLFKVGGSENKPVDLEIIRSFKRMRHFEPLEAIVAALKESKTLNLVDNDTKIQRKQPLPQVVDEWMNNPDKKHEPDHLRVFEDKAMPRTVYVKGFGDEVPSTQFDIEAWFAQFGPTNAIRLRRTKDDKSFKGSVFAEFENEDLAQQFLALEPKPKYKDQELKVMSKKEYCDGKIEDIKAGRIQASDDRPYDKQHKGRGGRFSERRRGGDDDRDWRTRREEDRKNGFRDDKRRDNRDKRGGRDRRRSDIEKDDKGIPVVKTEEKSAREKARADAIAQARAVVEADKKGENGDKPDAEEPIKKRGREEDGKDVNEEPATKKVDVKADS